MFESRKPTAPVKPVSVDLIFAYPCPFCNSHIQIMNPVQAAMARCDKCKKQFPILPVDGHTIRFVKIIMDGGRAAIDPDFI